MKLPLVASLLIAFVAFTGFDGALSEASSDDDLTIAFYRVNSGSEVYALDSAGNAEQLTCSGGTNWLPQFSNDGDHIVFNHEGRVKTLQVSDPCGTVVDLTSTWNSGGVDWADDDSYIAYACPTGVAICSYDLISDTQSGQIANLASTFPELNSIGSDLRVSPDGEHILVSASRGASQGEIYLVDLDGQSEPRRVTGPDPICDVADPDNRVAWINRDWNSNRMVWGSNGDQFAYLWLGPAGTPANETKVYIKSINDQTCDPGTIVSNTPSGATPIGFKDSETLVVWSGVDDDMYLVDLSSEEADPELIHESPVGVRDIGWDVFVESTPKPIVSGPTEISEGDTWEGQVEFEGSGTDSLITFYRGVGGSNVESWTMSGDGTGETLVSGPTTETLLQAYQPAISHDGELIAYKAFFGGDSAAIRIRKSDGSGSYLEVYSGDRFLGGPSWSPDGTEIAHVCSGGQGICITSLSGDLNSLTTISASTSVLINTGLPTVENTDWSETGHISYGPSFGPGEARIFMVQVSTGITTQLTFEQTHWGRWNSDGTKLAFMRNLDSLWIMEFSIDASTGALIPGTETQVTGPPSNSRPVGFLTDEELVVWNNPTSQTYVAGLSDTSISPVGTVSGDYQVAWDLAVLGPTLSQLQIDWGDSSTNDTDADAVSPQTISHLYKDDPVGTPDTYDIVATIDGVDSDPFTVTVNNVDPVVSSFDCTDEPVLVGNDVSCRADFTDVGVLDTHYGVFSWEPNAAVSAVEVDGAGYVEGQWTCPEPGVFELSGTVWDDDDGSDGPKSDIVVCYDPAAGFATGGGWLIPGKVNNSDPDDTLPGLDGTSKANFGFVVKYQNGQSTSPSGQLEFQYKVGDFNLHSLDYQWLVLTNDNWAKFQGTATINGEGEYPFKVEARDGQNGQPDRLVITIWDSGDDPGQNGMLYKASGDLGGGNIKIHD